MNISLKELFDMVSTVIQAYIIIVLVSHISTYIHATIVALRKPTFTKIEEKDASIYISIMMLRPNLSRIRMPGHIRIKWETKEALLHEYCHLLADIAISTLRKNWFTSEIFIQNRDYKESRYAGELVAWTIYNMIRPLDRKLYEEAISTYGMLEILPYEKLVENSKIALTKENIYWLYTRYYQNAQDYLLELSEEGKKLICGVVVEEDFVAKEEVYDKAH